MTARNEARQAALKSGAKRYIGEICVLHPELNGERNAKNRGCLGCNRDAQRIRREDGEYYRNVERVYYQRPEIKEKMREGISRRRTGIDRATAEKLIALQDGKCPICRRPLAALVAHRDHCHDTGRPRGILCGSCNRAEGIIRSLGISPEEFCENLTQYLESPTADKL